MKGESISRILFSPDPSFQKEGNGIRLPTRNPDEPIIIIKGTGQPDFLSI
jgi:hypothetical protein